MLEPLRSFLLSKTLAEIVEFLTAQSPPLVWRPASCDSRPCDSCEVKTTKLQQAYYNGSNGLLDNPCLLDVEVDFQELDVDRLSTCLKALVQRHPALRSRFVNRGLAGLKLQVEDPRAFDSWKLCVEDLQGAADVVGALSEIRQSHQDHVLKNLQWDLRVALLPGRTILFLRVGLIALDAGSLFRLGKELDLLYGGLPLEPLAYDFVGAMQRAANCTSLKQEIQSFPCPPLLPRVEAEKRGVQRVWASLDEKSWCSFVALCRREHLTPTAAITCCFQDVLRLRLGRQQEFTLNMTTTNRHQVSDQSDYLVGDFTNCQLILCRAGLNTFSDRAHAIQQQIDAYLAGPCCGIEMQQEARCCASTLITPFFDVVVTSLLGYQDWTPKHLPSHNVQRVVTQTPQVVFDLQFLVKDGVLWLSCDAAPVLALRWVEAVMKGLEMHLEHVIQQELKGELLPADPRQSHEAFAPKTDLTRLDAVLQRSSMEHWTRVAVADRLKELTYQRQGCSIQTTSRSG